MASNKIGIRPCTIIIKDEKVLCVHCKYTDGEYYLFPGGGVEPGETLAECAIRETEEETGLKVKIDKLVYVNDWIKDREKNERVVNMFFLASIVGGTVVQGEKDEGKVKSIEWIGMEKFKDIDFRPEKIKKRLETDYRKNFSDIFYFE